MQMCEENSTLKIYLFILFLRRAASKENPVAKTLNIQ